jgi:hypothetical protein
VVDDAGVVHVGTALEPPEVSTCPDVPTLATLPIASPLAFKIKGPVESVMAFPDISNTFEAFASPISTFITAARLGVVDDAGVVHVGTALEPPEVSTCPDVPTLATLPIAIPLLAFKIKGPIESVMAFPFIFKTWDASLPFNMTSPRVRLTASPGSPFSPVGPLGPVSPWVSTTLIG